jgi:hypothetical protein
MRHDPDWRGWRDWSLPSIWGIVMKTMLALVLAVAFAGWVATAYAQMGRTYKGACNSLPPKQCVQCAKSRGFPPERYKPYCGVR